jgi:hypothetical protein
VRRLVGSEMCIRDRYMAGNVKCKRTNRVKIAVVF